MKKIFFALALIISSLCVFSQSRIPLRGDSVVLEKPGGNAELILLNSTRDSLHGLLTNTGTGRTRFIKPRVINDSTIIIGLDTFTLRGGIGHSGNVGTVTTFSAGDLSPLFTTSEVTTTSTPALTFTLSNAGAYTVFGRNLGSSGVPGYFSPVLASALFSNQGTATTVLHGNAAGNPSFAAVSLASDVSGVLPNANLVNSTIGFNTPGITGTAPNWAGSSVALGNNAVLNIPYAGTAGVTMGLVSKVDYDAWYATSSGGLTNIPANRIIGRILPGTGSSSALTGTEVTTILSVFTSTDQGVVPASGGGTVNFMRADGIWAPPAGGGSNNGLLGSGFRTLSLGTQDHRTYFGSNTVLIDSSSNTNGLTWKVDTSLIATQYDLTLIAGGSLDATLAIGNSTSRSQIWVHDGTNPLIRTLQPVNYLTDYTGAGALVAQRFNETIAHVPFTNASGRPNEVWMFGYNNSSGGGRISTADASYHWSIETHFETGGHKFEDHKQITAMNGDSYRLQSWTINKADGSNTVYFTTNSMDFRLPESGTPAYLAAGDGVLGIYDNHTGLSQILLSPTGIGTAKIQYNGDFTVKDDIQDIFLTGSRKIEIPKWVTFGTAGGWTGDDVYFQMEGTAGAGRSFTFMDASLAELVKITDGATNTLRMYGDIHVNNNIAIGAAPAGFSALQISRSNTDGGSSNFPAINLVNTSTTLPTGADYNFSTYTARAGDGLVALQFIANYGPGATAPFDAGSGGIIAVRTNHPLFFSTNEVIRGSISNAGVWRINNLGGSGSGFVAVDNNGDLSFAASGGMISPMTTAGDMIYAGAFGAPTRLPGSATDAYVLTYSTSSAAPVWAAPAGASQWTTTGSDIYFADRIRVGSSGSPSHLVHVEKNQNAASRIYVKNSTSGANAQASFLFENDAAAVFQGGIYSTGTTAYGALLGGMTYSYSSSTVGHIIMADAGPVLFVANGTAEGMRLNTSSEFQIGSVTDLGAYKLQVTGDAIFAGALSITDDAYDATTWNGNLTVPTKNAIRDKIESLSFATPTLEQVITAGATLTGNNTIDNGSNTLTIAGTALPVVISTNPASTNSVVTALKVGRTTTSTPAAGLGGALEYELESTTTLRSAAKIMVSWTDATDASRSTVMDLSLAHSAGNTIPLSLFSSGLARLNVYGAGFGSGSPTFDLVVNTDGDIITRALGAVLQFTPANSTDNAYPNGTLTADDTFQYYRTSTGTWKKIAWTTF